MEGLSYLAGANLFELDGDLKTLLAHYDPGFKEREGEYRAFGERMGKEVLEILYHIDQDAPPALVMHDLDGKRIDRVRLSPAQKHLLEALRPLNRFAYEGKGWVPHFALGYLLADGGVYCILTITHQVAYALHKYAPEHQKVKEALLYGDAFGATWMTEIQGGSDLGANRTLAILEGDRWRLYGGDKYFASGAGLADYALVTARPEGAPAGARGLALFLLPRLTRKGELNFKVRRLKAKLGTRAVPSGEVELEGSEAYLIGQKGEGIYYTLENLTVSRLANAVAAMGIAQKSFLEAFFRARKRESFGRRLLDHPLIRRDLVDLRVRQAGGLALAFHAVSAFDRAWEERPPYSPRYHLARFLSHLAKNRTAEHAQKSTALAMELFGGLGFLEEYGVARWHREALITPIWEGPSNIQALDLLEAMEKKGAHLLYLEELSALLEGHGEPEAALALEVAERTLEFLKAQKELAWYAKEGLRRLADALSVAVLLRLGEAYEPLARLYAHRFLKREEYPAWAGGWLLAASLGER